MVWEPGHGLAGSSPSGSLITTVKVAAEAGVSSEGSTEEGPASKLTHLVAGKIQFPVGCWTKALSLSPSICWRPPSVPCHMGLHRAARSVARQHIINWTSKRKHPWQRPQSYYLIPEVTSHHLCRFLVEASQQVCPTRQGRWWHKGTHIRGQGSWGDHVRDCLSWAERS